MVSNNYIADRLRELRKHAGLDVDTVGKGVGRSGKTISAWETGRNVPSADMLISICKFFGVDIDYFYPPEVTRNANGDFAPLSPEEQELVSLYRSSNAHGREQMMVFSRGCAATYPLNQAVSASA